MALDTMSHPTLTGEQMQDRQCQGMGRWPGRWLMRLAQSPAGTPALAVCPGSVPDIRMLSPFTGAQGAKAACAPSKTAEDAELGLMLQRVMLPWGGTRQAGGGGREGPPHFPTGKGKVLLQGGITLGPARGEQLHRDRPGRPAGHQVL